jgi:hypothetical protein
MGVGGRGGGGGRGLPTPLDFFTNSGLNSVPLLPESLWHARRLFGASLTVFRYCELSHGQKSPKLCNCRGSPTFATYK